MELSNIAAIVTGGASGLGAATAELLARGGARVAIFDVNDSAGPGHAAKIGGLYVNVNITNEQAVTAGIESAQAKHGVARILVNCAGIVHGSKAVSRDFVPHSIAEFRRVLDVNLTGTFCMISNFAARCAQTERIGEERGVIINTASVAAFDGQIGQAAYASSKAGIVGLTLPVARELSQFGIRVCSIAPGIFWTPMMESLTQAAQDSLAKQVPFPSRLGKPEEFAHLVRSIIENPMLNGETIRLDGAIRMAPR